MSSSAGAAAEKQEQQHDEAKEQPKHDGAGPGRPKELASPTPAHTGAPAVGASSTDREALEYHARKKHVAESVPGAIGSELGRYSRSHSVNWW